MSSFTKFVVLVTVVVLMPVFGFAQTVSLQTSVSTPWLLAGEAQTAFLKISLTGFPLESSTERTPVNVAVVLDRSGSMDGEKIVKAREAAKMAVNLLESRDIASIVTYSDTVSILVPATKVSENRYFYDRIDTIYADGSTALFAGVSKGAEELRKFLDIERVNRVILLSDGLANVGPDSPAALGDLGASLRRSGISVTTIGLGLGYNEDLMVRLAERSDGNHAFVENSRDLARIFEYEFGDILSVVAQDVEIEIQCSPGIRPIRVLGREADIIGSNVYTSINQLYSNQEKYILVEVEVDSHRPGQEISMADVLLRYNNMVSQKTDRLSGDAKIFFTANEKEVEQNVDQEAMVSAVLQLATEKSEEAMRLRDQGRVEEAQATMEESSEYLLQAADEFDSDELAGYGESLAEGAEAMEDEEEWKETRKQMRDDQHENKSQQSY